MQARHEFSWQSGTRWALGGLLVLALGCGSQPGEPVVDGTDGDPPSTSTPECTSNGVTFDLDCAALPDTSALGKWVDDTGTVLATQPSDGQSDTSAYLDYDLWAWNSFVALNWPAIEPSEANGYQRGFPDLSQSFAGAAHDSLTVWETFKEKREVFLFDYVSNEPSSEVPQAWNAEPQYGPSNAQVPDCTTSASSTENGASSAGFERHLTATSKTGTVYDTEDETVEVASEARETRDALCAGWVDDPATDCNIIGANSCCTLTGSIVGPRVWQGDPHTNSSAKPVLYEVKVNYDFYQYVIDNSYYLVDTARTAASNGEIHLPARTSISSMPPAPGQKAGGTKGPNPGPTSYSSTTCLGTTTGTPCLAGSVHLKAAWLDVSDLSADEQAEYHTAEVYHYLSTGDPSSSVCKETSTYGLVGLHIIQRIHQGTSLSEGSGEQPPGGGTFVFATWEHTGNDSAGYTYANYSGAPPTASPTSLQPFPNVEEASALDLERVYPILDSTARANTLVHDALGCPGSGSVWCNYQLVGTQYRATATPSPEPTQLTSLEPQSANIEAPSNSGQPYYLANLVIESNVGLQQFQGLPPTTDANVIQVIDHYQNGNPGNVTSMFTTNFQRSAANLAYRTQNTGKNSTYEYVMGGCMGCHGVAQLSGYAFSFVLLDNQYGAKPDTLTDFAIAPTPDPPPAPSSD